MKATATAAAPAPNAEAMTVKKEPAWLRMPESAFDAYLKTAKIGGKRAEEMRARRLETAGQDGRVEVTDHGDSTTGVLVHDAKGPQPLGPLLDEEDEKRLAAVKAEKANSAALAGAAEDMAQGLVTAAKKRKVDPGLVAAIGERMKVIKGGAGAPAPGLVTRYIDPNLIDVREGWNARVDFGDLEELAASIKAQKKIDGHGLVNDLRVKEKPDGRYEIIDGERRWQAVMGLQDRGESWEFGIPAKVEPAESTDAELIIKMFVANGGKPFLPYEEAIYYKRLRDEGWTISQIEEKTGRSDNSIVGALALLEADDDLVQAVVKGQVGATLGKSIAVNVRGNKERQKELVKQAVTAKKSGDKAAMKQVNKAIDEERRKKAAKKMPGKQLKARMLDEGDIATIGTNVGLRLKELMEMVGLPYDTDLSEWVSNDRELQIAANYGALTALRAVMGDKAAPKVEF